jgi:hypothetical protein
MMIVTLCLFAVVGFGLGLTVRWPVLALIAMLSLFGSAVLLGWSGHGWLASTGWSAAVVILLEIGFLLGSLTVDHGALKDRSSSQASDIPDSWAGEQVSGGNAILGSQAARISTDDPRS